MDRQIQKQKGPANKAALLEWVKEVCNLSLDVLQKLIDWITKVIEAILAAKCGYFDRKYDVGKWKYQTVFWVLEV